VERGGRPFPSAPGPDLAKERTLTFLRVGKDQSRDGERGQKEPNLTLLFSSAFPSFPSLVGHRRACTTRALPCCRPRPPPSARPPGIGTLSLSEQRNPIPVSHPRGGEESARCKREGGRYIGWGECQKVSLVLALSVTRPLECRSMYQAAILVLYTNRIISITFIPLEPNANSCAKVQTREGDISPLYFPFTSFPFHPLRSLSVCDCVFVVRARQSVCERNYGFQRARQ